MRDGAGAIRCSPPLSGTSISLTTGAAGQLSLYCPGRDCTWSRIGWLAARRVVCYYNRSKVVVGQDAVLLLVPGVLTCQETR